MPLTGRPMLSTIGVQFGRRDGLADRLLDVVEQGRGVLDPGADRRAHVQGHLRRNRPPGRSSRPGTAPGANESDHQPRKPIDEQAAGAPAPAPAGRGSPRAPPRSAPRSRAGSGPADCATLRRAPWPWPSSANRAWPDVRAACSRYIAMVGTRVRDSTNEAIMANTTASAIGTNRKPATPCSEEHRHEHDADAQQRDEGRRRRSAARRRGWRS